MKIRKKNTFIFSILSSLAIIIFCFFKYDFYNCNIHPKNVKLDTIRYDQRSCWDVIIRNYSFSKLHVYKIITGCKCVKFDLSDSTIRPFHKNIAIITLIPDFEGPFKRPIELLFDNRDSPGIIYFSGYVKIE